jgi:hypothetical protein
MKGHAPPKQYPKRGERSLSCAEVKRALKRCRMRCNQSTKTATREEDSSVHETAKVHDRSPLERRRSLEIGVNLDLSGDRMVTL